MSAVRLAFVGFGDLAGVLAAQARRGGVAEVRAWARLRPDAAGEAALGARIEAAGAQRCETVEAAVGGADVVMAAVPAAASATTVAACAPWLRAGALYADPAPLPPPQKARLADLVARAGGEYVDVAVLGSVAVAGAAVPMLAAGRGARRFADTLAPCGFDVRVIDGPAGRASLIKLVRSVYLKGREALVLEMVLAARRLGIEQEVLDSVRGPGEEVAFPALAERILCSLAAYSGRRADELAASARLIEEAGVEPLVAGAAAARLARLDGDGLRRRFHGERAARGADVLAAIEEASRPGQAGS
ncbi:MAG TPA: DUF1932 domain-containing protein [Solirubrobacteraceae bacterium]|nr:DUF1932 domain-containing protein [Solirubrobacteraceae bacterium]